MSAKRKSDSGEGRGKNKNKKNDEDIEEFEDENDGLSDASEKDNDENDDTNDESAQEFLPNSEASEKLKEKTAGNVGVLLICGGVNWDMIGRKLPPKSAKNASSTQLNIYTPSRFIPETRVRLVVSGCSAAHNIIITEEGKAMTFGRNDRGQLGCGDVKTRDQLTLVEALKYYHIVDAAAGKGHSMFLTERGTVFCVGDNKCGQLGIGKNSKDMQMIETPRIIKYKGPPVVKVGCGGEFSMILDVQGNLYSFGMPEHGQLGHNSDGQYFINGSRLSYAFVTAPKRISLFIEKTKDGHTTPIQVDEIVDFSCGQNHSVATDGRKRAFSWGFGGYGRLGHAEPKDELVPRLIKFFEVQGRGIKGVYCGAAYTLALNDIGALYLFGMTKRTGEANMYPKPLQDLSGWNIRSVACAHTSTVIAADESVISWGPSPTNGELGLGEFRKSSTTPMEVKSLEGIHINQVSCGMATTLMIARDTTDAEKEKIKNLEEFQP